VKKIVLCVTFFGLFYQMFLSTTNVGLIFKNLENRSAKFYSQSETDQELRKSFISQENDILELSEQLPNLFFDNLPELEVASELIYLTSSPLLLVLLISNCLHFDDPSQIELLNLEYSVPKPPSQFKVYS